MPESRVGESVEASKRGSAEASRCESVAGCERKEARRRGNEEAWMRVEARKRVIVETWMRGGAEAS